MEGKDIKGDNHQDLLVNFGDSPSQVRKETADFLRRETDSMDDFEHLEHDNQHPLDIKSEKPKQYTENDKLINIGFVTRVESDTDRINTAKEPAEIAQKSLDEFMLTSETDKDYDKNINLFDLSHESSMKPLVVDNLGDLGQVPPIPPHAESMKTTVDKGFGDFQQKPSIPIFESQNFMDMERHTPSFSPAKTPDLADRFSDSEPEIDDFKPSSNVLSYQKTEPKSEESSKPEMFKDVIDQPEPLPERDYFESPSDYVPKFEAESVFERKSEPVFVPEPVKEVPKPILEQPKVVIDEPKPVINEPELLLHETVREDPKPEPVKRAAEPPKVIKCQLERSQPKKEAMGAELMFCKMGLDAWFNPERLNPQVESLIYWRDPKKSGIVFGGTLVVLLSLAYFSLISVFAYLSLLALVGTISFRIYKNVLQAVQKTSDGHPFKEFLEADLNLPQDKVREVSEVAVTHMNAALTELRRLFLVEDLVDSIKFGVLLWCLTYLGAWFNGMTLLIIAFVALFTLPKVYENNKTQIDANLDVVRTKVAEITSKVKAAIPIGKKTEEKKEQ